MEAPNTPKEVLDMISVAMVCRSNMNRSMEAHYRAYKRGYAVSSYGTGKLVRIPGANRIPKEYVFGTPYQSIYRSMMEEKKDAMFYSRNGMLQMIDRNRNVKVAPEKWQHCSMLFDLVICFEEPVFLAALNSLQDKQVSQVGQGLQGRKAVHVVNIQTTDTPAAAKLGAETANNLIDMLYEFEHEWNDHVDDVIDELESETQTQILHSVIFLGY